MTLNELLLPRMEKFLMRFPAFQKLEEMAAVNEAIAVEPIEEVVVVEAPPQPMEYEIMRANAIAERERTSQAKLERVLNYTLHQADDGCLYERGRVKPFVQLHHRV